MAACRLCRRQEPTLAEILLSLPFPTRIGGSTAGRTRPPAEVVAEIGPAGIVVSERIIPRAPSAITRHIRIALVGRNIAVGAGMTVRADIAVYAAVVRVDDNLSERRGCRAQLEYSGKPAANRHFPDEVCHCWFLESPMHVIPTQRRQLGFPVPSGWLGLELASSRRAASGAQEPHRDAEFRPLPRRNPAPRRAARRRSRSGLHARGLAPAPQASPASLRAMD